MSIEISGPARRGASERIHVSTPSIAARLAAARVQETLYEQRARCTITISHQSGFRSIGNAENANKTNTPYARARVHDTRGDILVYVTNRLSLDRRRSLAR